MKEAFIGKPHFDIPVNEAYPRAVIRMKATHGVMWWLKCAPGTGDVLVRHHDPANRMWNSPLLSIAGAGPLDRRGNQPGTGDGNTTRLRRVWHG